MEIELVTTKKKLTASIVKQIPFATSLEKERLFESTSKIYGYVTVGAKDYIIAKGETGLIRVQVRYWKTSISSLNIFSLKANRRFDSLEARDRWLEVHNEILRIGKQTHIYL